MLQQNSQIKLNDSNSKNACIGVPHVHGTKEQTINLRVNLASSNDMIYNYERSRSKLRAFCTSMGVRGVSE